MASPIQIILNQENFEQARDVGGGAAQEDFFARTTTLSERTRQR